VDGRPNRRNKAAFSNFSDVVWTGPRLRAWSHIMMIIHITGDVLKVSVNRIATGQEMVRKNKILQGRGKVREYYFSRRKLAFCRNVLKAGRNIWCHCDLNDAFPWWRRKNCWNHISFNEWAERTAVGKNRSLTKSDILYLFGLGNVIFIREQSDNFEKWCPGSQG